MLETSLITVLVSFTICWPNFYSLANINPRKPHKVCGCLIFASIRVQMQRYPLEDFKWKYLHLQLLSSDCVIYQNLPILLYITVIKLASNIISNLNTYICLSCIIFKGVPLHLNTYTCKYQTATYLMRFSWVDIG
jgi:hypothetical protein